MMWSLLAQWPLQPAIIAGVVLSALLYIRGVAYSRRHGIVRSLRWWRHLAFGAGLVVVLLALDSPLDVLADQWFWAHMVQHEALTILAAPLLLLGAPALPMWRAVPLAARRTSLRWLLRAGWPRRYWHTVSHIATRPVATWVAFNVLFTVWHLPALYDLALRSEPVHIVEHMTFLGTALLFWSAIIPVFPAHARLSYPAKALYLGAAGIWSNVMGAVFIFSTGVLYPYYASVPHPAGGLSALADQHLGESRGRGVRERPLDAPLRRHRVGVDLAEADDPGVGRDLDDQGVLAAVALGLHLRQPQVDRLD